MCNYCQRPSCNGGCRAHVWPPLTPCGCNGCIDSFGTNCVLTSIALTCVNLGPGTNLTVVLQAMDTKLCQLTSGTIPCPTWTTATLDDPLADLDWTTGSGTPPTIAQYSAPIGCQVRLRGGLTAAGIDPVATNSINTQLFVLGAGSRPLIDKVLTINVLVNSDNQFTSLTVPALLIIRTTGEVILGLTNFNPFVPSASTCPDCSGTDPVATFGRWFIGATTLIFAISLDGLAFDRQA